MIEQREPLPDEIRGLAGIEPGQIDHNNRSRLLIRYEAAKQVLRMSGMCQQFKASDEPCVACRSDEPDERLCIRYKSLGSIASNEGETLI